MKIVGFSVTNFRSITKTEYMATSDFTVLIGQNNEGKSNILAALVTAMQIIKDHAEAETDDSDNRNFVWRRDFPISFQSEPGSRRTEFRLEFELDSNETQDFKKKIGALINGFLTISISIGKDDSPKFRVVKSGKNTTDLAAKSTNIADFIGRRIAITYIPTIRTEEQSTSIIQKMISRELAQLESDPEYLKSLRLIEAKQQEIYKSLSKRLTTSIQQFLPQIRQVEIRAGMGRARTTRYVPSIVIDDGNRTSISRKGDGIKSVVALSLFEQLEVRDGVFTVLAIEEPESHLHPGAIHSLREVLQTMAGQKQIFITTHCPSLINRDHVASNIIVKANRATPAKRISEIRSVLGVVASDNLSNASLVLLVEGEDDAIVIDAYFRKFSSKISSSLQNGSIKIEAIGGASKLPYHATLFMSQICSVHALVDGDDEGITARDKVIEANILKIAHINTINCKGMSESEFEDMLALESYRQEIKDEYGVDLKRAEFRGNKLKWSERVESCFGAASKPWSAKIKNKVKLLVARAVADKISAGEDVLDPIRGQPLVELLQAIESRL